MFFCLIFSVFFIFISAERDSLTNANYSLSSSPLEVFKSKYSVEAFPSNPTYGIIKVYDNAECTGNYHASSIVIDVCLAAAPRSYSPYTTNYFQFYCNDESLLQGTYSDSTCQNLLSEFVFPDGCSYSADVDLYFHAQCTKTKNPYKVFGDDFAIKSFYNDAACSTKQLINAVGQKVDVCLKSSSTSSSKIILDPLPIFYEYTTSTDCTGAADTELAVDGCSGYTSDDDTYYDYDYNSYVDYKLKTITKSTQTETIIIIVVVVGAVLILVGAGLYYHFFCRSKFTQVASN